MLAMTTISNWFKKLFAAIVPSQEGNAWDELKRARAMELQRARIREEKVSARRYQ